MGGRRGQSWTKFLFRDNLGGVFCLGLEFTVDASSSDSLTEREGAGQGVKQMGCVSLKAS